MDCPKYSLIEWPTGEWGVLDADEEFVPLSHLPQPDEGMYVLGTQAQAEKELLLRVAT